MERENDERIEKKRIKKTMKGKGYVGDRERKPENTKGKMEKVDLMEAGSRWRD